MNYLLDTHVWIWGAVEPAVLPASVQGALSAADASLHLSPLSLDEALQLGRRGRLSLPPDPVTWARAVLSATGVEEAPLTLEIAEAAAGLALETKDPMDRLIAATAKVNRFTLVTADRRLAKIPGVDVLAFRPPR